MALKAERDQIQSNLRLHRESETEWKSKFEALREDHSTTQARLTSLTSVHDALLREKSHLEPLVQTEQAKATEYREQLAQAALQLNDATRQLHIVQSDLRVATRRAEEAESAQIDLQTEGTTLMRSLDEVRTKVVELSGAKLELGEKVDALEHVLRARDSVIAQMEAAQEEARNERELLEKRHQGLLERDYKENLSAQEGYAELQNAY